MTEQPFPCTTPGCESVKYFPGPCNLCQRTAEKSLPPLIDPYAGLSEVEEYMVRTGIPRERVFAQTRKAAQDD